MVADGNTTRARSRIGLSRDQQTVDSRKAHHVRRSSPNGPYRTCFEEAVRRTLELQGLMIAVAKALDEKHSGKVSGIDGEGHTDPRQTQGVTE